MNTRSIALSVAISLGSVGFVEAQQPAIGDIALCNQEATKQTGGSAFPGPRPRLEISREGEDQKGTRDMPEARGGTPSGGQPGGQLGEKTDPTGSIIAQSPDPLVKGMDADKADDPAYRTAYRDCMWQRMGQAP